MNIIKKKKKEKKKKGRSFDYVPRIKRAIFHICQSMNFLGSDVGLFQNLTVCKENNVDILIFGFNKLNEI